MTVLFISHSSEDSELAQRVHDRLVEEGFSAVFLDFDPDDGIRPGRDWERELYLQLRRADAVVFLGTKAAVGSSWCHAEVVLARSVGKPVFPVNAGAVHPLLKDVQWVTESRLVEGLRQAGLVPHDSFAWNASRPPYPGLESFSAKDAAVFFGRQTEIEHLQRLLTPTLERGANRFVAVVGPSGSGKTSLIRAGLLPRLARTPDRWQVLPPLLPGKRPLRNLARVLACTPQDVEELTNRLTPEMLGDLLHTRGATSALLFVDQAEELLRADPQESQAFLELLTRTDAPLWIVATLRSEFLGAAQELTTLIDDPILLEPLGRSRLAEVIERPAIRAGIAFQEGLVSRIVADTAGGDALPMLAYTLRALWERTSPGDTLSHEDYEAVGGVAGALRRVAERLTAELQHQDRAAAIVPTLLRLVDVDAEGTLTRRRLPLAALNPVETEVVCAFVDARLLTTTESAVDVAHEALIRQWPPLREAAESRRDDLRQRRELERLAHEWDRAGRPDGYLLRSERATDARAWAHANPDFASDATLVAEFVELSAYHDETERHRLAEVLGSRILESFDDEAELRLPLALAAVEDYAPTPKAVQALAKALQSPRLCARFAPERWDVASVNWSPDGTKIVSAITVPDSRHRGRAVIWDPATGAEVASVDHDHSIDARWSPDGNRIAVVAQRTTSVYDLTLTTCLHRIDAINVRWSPDGSRFGGLVPEQTHLAVWDADTGAKLRTVPARVFTPAGQVECWSPSGRLLVCDTDLQETEVWNAETGALIIRLYGGKPSWSPDGAWIATLGDRDIHFWPVNGLRRSPILRKFHGNEPGYGYRMNERVTSGLRWSPDSSRIAMGTEQGIVRTLCVRTFSESKEPAVGPAIHKSAVDDIAWSPDGTRQVVLSKGVASVWDLNDPGPGTALDRSAHGLSWSPDGARLLTWHNDLVTIWNPLTNRVTGTFRPRSEHPLTIHGAGEPIQVAAWSPDQTRVLIATSKNITIWDVERSLVLAALPRGLAASSSAAGVAWSPAGDRIAVNEGGVYSVLVWDVAGEKPPLELHLEAVAESFAWSPDGRRLLTGSRAARVWDAATGTELCRFDANAYDVSWSPSSTAVLVGYRRDGATLYDPDTGTRLGGIKARGGFFKPLAWARNGDRLMTKHGAQVMIQDPVSGAVHATLKGHTAEIVSAGWSPDETKVLTSSLDGIARIWEAATGTELACLIDGATGCRAAAWSPDGTKIATSGENYTIRVWSADQPANLIATARRVVARELTIDERRRFGLPIPALPAR